MHCSANSKPWLPEHVIVLDARPEKADLMAMDIINGASNSKLHDGLQWSCSDHSCEDTSNWPVVLDYLFMENLASIGTSLLGGTAQHAAKVNGRQFDLSPASDDTG